VVEILRGNMDIKQHIKESPTWLKLTVIGVIGLVAAPIAYVMIKGLIGLIIAVAIVGVAWNFGPWLADWIANRALDARKNEWKESPIPTLQRQYMERVHSLEARKEGLKSTIAGVEEFRSIVRNYAQRFPKNIDKIKHYNDRLIQLERVEANQKLKFELAIRSVSSFNDTIQEAEAEWNVICALRKANKAAQINEDPLEALKERTALGSVETEMNKCFAELDVALLDQPKFDELEVDGVRLQIPVKEKQA
jgi:hypothetical protein